MRRLFMVLLTLAVAGVFGCADTKKTSMKIYVQQKLYDKAIAQGEGSLALSPDDGDTHYFLGAAYFGKDLDLDTESSTYEDSATTFVTKAYEHFSLAKKNAEASWGTDADDNIISMFGRHYNRGVIAAKKIDHTTAAMEYRLATIADPENFQGYYARASSLFQLAQEAKKNGDDQEFENMSKAIIADLDKVLELGTQDKEIDIAVHQTRGEVMYMNGRLDDAEKAYKRAIQLSPENYALMITMGERFYNEQDWENAIDYLQQAMEVKTRLNVIDSDDSQTYSAIGNAMSKLERRGDAVQAFGKALELKPDDSDILLNITVTHYKTGEAAEKGGDTATAKSQYKKAISLCDQLIANNPSNPVYWQIRGLSKRGVGDFAGAARDLKEFKDLRG